MKRTLLAAALALLGAFAFVQERIAIAVFPFEDLDNVLSRNESVLFYREFSNEFTNTSAGKFNVVPRQEVEKLINTEAAFQLSDLSAKAKTAEMQRVLNGAQILSGVIGKAGSRLTISVSLYTYPELVLQPGGNSVRVANVDELFDKIPELVQSMQNAIASSKPPAPAPRKIYKIGDRGPGGGIVFSVNDNTYMECSGELGDIDSGSQASEMARNYRGGGFSDWRVPSREELTRMYVNLKQNKLGNFSNGWYYSNTGHVASGAYIHFGDGKRSNNWVVIVKLRLRAVREFSQ